MATTRKTAARKTAAPKATAKKSTPPAHVRKQAAEVEAMVPAGPAKKAAGKKVLQKDTPYESRDWTYLDDKDPSEQNVLLAKEINMRTNIEITAKQVQAVLSMHPHFQRSKTNKSRPGYHGLDSVIVEQRSIHMTQAHKDAAEILNGLAAEQLAKKPVAKKAPAKKTAAAKTEAPAAASAPVKKAAPARRRTAKKTTPAAPAAAEAF